MNKKASKGEKNVTIDWDTLPIGITFVSKRGKQEYIFRTNKEKTKLFLNKKEY